MILQREQKSKFIKIILWNNNNSFSPIVLIDLFIFVLIICNLYIFIDLFYWLLNT